MKKRVKFSFMLTLILFSATVFAATITVANVNDTGAGSLRQAITDANSNTGADTIIFSISGTIQPASVLPTLNDTTGGTIIFAGLAHDVEIDGSNTLNVSGLTISSANNVVSGLVINNFTGALGFRTSSIIITGVSATGNIIANNYMGTDATGTVDLGNAYAGIYLTDHASGNTIGGSIAGMGNLISGSYIANIIMRQCDGNYILGNKIGTDVNGTSALGADYSGINISYSNYNIIGGTTAAERNLVSGNGEHGIFVDACTGTQILGNYFGTDISGTSALGNTQCGVYITNTSTYNIVGSTIAGGGNVLSGNQYGVLINGNPGVENNTVIGNFIGTDATGLADLGNSACGVYIAGGAQLNTIGGTDTAARNIISGNNQSGVHIYGSGTDNNHILGNYIGTDATGTLALGNLGSGIRINIGEYNIIGSTVPGGRNIISGNDNSGILISSNGTDNNVVLGNYIGTDVSGTLDLGNSDYGVAIYNGAKSNMIGGAAAGAGNIISGNDQLGVYIRDNGTDNNQVLGNHIGTNAAGDAALGNTQSGVHIMSGAQSNIIGGTAAGARNIISGNNASGVYLGSSGTDNNQVLGNYIGTNAAGDAALGNTQAGVFILSGAQSNTIGGIIAGARNIISGNKEYGIYIRDSGTDNNVVLGNYIGTDINGTVDLGNAMTGVYIVGAAKSNTIGGTTAGAGNIISGNNRHGVGVMGSGTDNNVVYGNYIGTNAAGDTDLGNSWNGIQISGVAKSNIIGGTDAEARNIISGNGQNGIRILSSGTDNNQVLGNYIGTNAAGDAALGNTQSGVLIMSGAQSNTIGGTVAAARNIISGNDQYGVYITDGGTDNNQILGNYIGTDVSGTIDLGNSWSGVYIYNGAQANIIGGTIAAARNIISGNDDLGVLIQQSGTDNNQVLGNYIGTDVNGTADLGNSSIGIYIGNDAQSNTIGGTVAGMANIIAFNGSVGVCIHGTLTDNNRISGNSIFSNTGLGIDLAADGVTLNDIGDVDTGPNENLNFPVITDIVQTGIDTYTINGTAAAGIEIELYIVSNSTAGVNADPTGYGEGYHYYTTLNTDGSGNFSLAGESIAGDAILSSLAIDGTGNTSEFGANRAILNDLTSVINDDAPTTAMQGAEVLMADITLSTDANNTIWTDIKVEGGGTNVDSDVSLIMIYADNGNTTFSSAEDTLLGSGTFVSGLVDIDITDQNITTASSVYFIVLGLGSAVDIGNTFTISMSDSSNFTIMAPDHMTAFTPFLSGSVTITDGPDPITVLPLDLAAAATKVSVQDLVFEQLTLSTAIETAVLSVIKTDLIGTADDNDVSAAKVYLDNGDSTFSVTDDTLIGTGTFTSGTADINIADQIIGTTAKTYFLCLDIAADAVNGHTIGISCVDTTYFTVISPDTVSEANIPFESGLTTIKNYADSLEDTVIYPNPWNKELSGEYIIFSQLTEDVTIRIYTVAGELVLETDADGQSEWQWDLTNEDGEEVAAGMYFCYITNDAGETQIFKVAAIK
ncbi:hypothetical protein KAU32_10030 [bacterium]|nr:hypothetical protein [bacterium]